MLDRDQLAQGIIERQLAGCCKTDEDVSSDQLIYVVSSGANDAADCSKQRSTGEEPAAAKDVREASNEGVADR